MRLYTVEIKYEMVIWAEDPQGAIDVARYYAKEAINV